MKNEKIIGNLIWVFLLLPVIITLVLYSRLPEQIPMHWNINGEIDSWYPKFPGAFILPATAIFVTVFIMLLPKLDPRKENYGRFKKQYLVIQLLMVVFFAVIQIVTLFISMGAEFINMDTIVKLMVGVLFLIMGNLMPKLKQNYFVGIKTPWTLHSESVWKESHRHGGIVWFIAGFIMSILAFIPGEASAIIYFAVIMVAGFEPVVYSWLKFNKLSSRQNGN